MTLTVHYRKTEGSALRFERFKHVRFLECMFGTYVLQSYGLATAATRIPMESVKYITVESADDGR